MSLVIGSLEVTVSSPAQPPFSIGARLYEEDTYLALSAPSVVPEVSHHPIRVMTGLLRAEPKIPGTLVRASTRRWLAVIHDLDREPSTCTEWIRSALDEALTAADREGLAAIGVCVLGTSYGRSFPWAFSLDILGEALSSRWFHRLERVWVIAEDDKERQVEERLSVFVR